MSTATKTYEYSVRDRKGKLVSGKLEAPTEAALVQKLRGMGYAPVSVREANSGMNREISLPFGGGVGLKDLAVMSRQFATMINSGLSLLRALSILSEQTENATLAKALADVRATVEGGQALSTAMARHPNVFPPSDDQHDPGRRGRRLPRRRAAADRRQLRGRGPAPRQDQVGDDLPGRGLRDRHPRGGRHAAVHRADLRQDVQRPRRHAARPRPGCWSGSPTRSGSARRS